MRISVKNCGDCPFLYQNVDYPASTCKAVNRSFGMSYYQQGNDAPDWCPLARKHAVIVEMKD